MSRDHLGQFMVSSSLGFARGILLLDDCEGTFTWVPTGTGGDDVHEFATVAAFMGLKGMRLKTRTTGAAANDNLTASKMVSYPESGLLVVRGRFASPDVSLCLGVGLSCLDDDGVTQYIPELYWIPGSAEVGYVSAASAYVPIAALATVFLDGQWYTWELVYDCLTHRYVSATFNGTRVSLANIGARTPGASSGRGVQVRVFVSAAGAAAAELYADSIYAGEFLDL